MGGCKGRRVGEHKGRRVQVWKGAKAEGPEDTRVGGHYLVGGCKGRRVQG